MPDCNARNRNAVKPSALRVQRGRIRAAGRSSYLLVRSEAKGFGTTFPAARNQFTEGARRGMSARDPSPACGTMRCI